MLNDITHRLHWIISICTNIKIVKVDERNFTLKDLVMHFFFQNQIAGTASARVHWCCRQNCASTNITIKYVVNHAEDGKIRTFGMLYSEVLRPRVTEVNGSSSRLREATLDSWFNVRPVRQLYILYINSIAVLQVYGQSNSCILCIYEVHVRASVVNPI